MVDIERWRSARALPPLLLGLTVVTAALALACVLQAAVAGSVRALSAGTAEDRWAAPAT
ncbi:hypothetical protein [Pseudonocardia acidicola]|uniref:Uncharacterized protein n=1 Tax=Pseudonocardia acidicola TaxID=2724939 RepID=A0ABX1SB03_9PSEU|nr:hypothetical protein [Pseudonocardia acidicola]NMH97429.1 hypothetical protein [Pseudonocardia acidicola]